MVYWYKCIECGENIDEFDPRYIEPDKGRYLCRTCLQIWSSNWGEECQQ